MPRSLREQIAELASEIIHLKKELRDTNLPEYQRTERELALANAEEALKHLRKAYDLEHGSPSN